MESERSAGYIEQQFQHVIERFQVCRRELPLWTGNARAAEIDLFGRRSDIWTPLLLAAEKDNRGVIMVLLETGADPDVKQTSQGQTALDLAFGLRGTVEYELLEAATN